MCVRVCLTLSVSSVVCETARLSGVQQLGESPQAEGSTLLTLSPTPGGTNVITALPSASPACPHPALSLWIKNKPTEKRTARRQTNTKQNRVWVKWNSKADWENLQSSFCISFLFPLILLMKQQKLGKVQKKKNFYKHIFDHKNVNNGEQYNKLKLDCCIHYLITFNYNVCWHRSFV